MGMVNRVVEPVEAPADPQCPSGIEPMRSALTFYEKWRLICLDLRDPSPRPTPVSLRARARASRGRFPRRPRSNTA